MGQRGPRRPGPPSLTFCTSASRLWGCPTWHTTPLTSSPSRRSCPTAAATCGARRELRTTEAPATPRARDTASPILGEMGGRDVGRSSGAGGSIGLGVYGTGSVGLGGPWDTWGGYGALRGLYGAIGGCYGPLGIIKGHLWGTVSDLWGWIDGAGGVYGVLIGHYGTLGGHLWVSMGLRALWGRIYGADLWG